MRRKIILELRRILWPITIDLFENDIFFNFLNDL